MTPTATEGASVGRPPADARRLQLLSSRLVTGIFAGEYRSVFRGQGIEFEEVREYEPGDDVRGIDWNVTARTGRPHVKQYVEEREMTVMLALDRSESLDALTPRGTKAQLAREVCALLAFAAARSHDRVGLLAFSDRILQFIPPAKGGRHAQRVVAELSQQALARRRTDLAAALDYLDRVLRRASIVFLVSDFFDTGFALPLARLARRHDVVAVPISDVADVELGATGLVVAAGAEGGIRRVIDTGDERVQRAYREHAAARRARLRDVLAIAGVDALEVAAGTPAVVALTRYFDRRRRRIGGPR